MLIKGVQEPEMLGERALLAPLRLASPLFGPTRSFFSPKSAAEFRYANLKGPFC